jgi:hypothetical protein
VLRDKAEVVVSVAAFFDVLQLLALFSSLSVFFWLLLSGRLTMRKMRNWF